jgi:hypothetical protein
VLVATGLGAVLVASGCGGGDDTAEPAATTQQTTTRAAASASGKLPDACGLVDDAAAGTAMGGSVASKAAPQAATEVSSRCEWKGGGPYSLSLLVRRGNDAKSSFDNTVSSGFSATTLAGADARVRLGARETSRNYRLVSYAAYNGTYFVHVVLQGPDREDAAATDAAAGLVRSALSKLQS